MCGRLYILDPGLKGGLGHYFEYDHAILRAAAQRSIPCTVLAHGSFSADSASDFDIRSIYSSDIWSIVRGNAYNAESNIRAVAEEFVAETLRELSASSIDNEDTIYLPNIANAHLLGAAILAESLARQKAQLSLMLRYPKSFYDGVTAVEAFRRLEAAGQSGSVKLCTDSHRLRQNLSALTTLPIRVLPIPHTDHLHGTERMRVGGSALHCVSLGNARGEKGLAEIFEAIRISRSAPWQDQVQFTLQCNDPSADIIEAVETFRRDADPRVTLIHEVLDSPAYYRLLDSADVVLVPYHRDIYAERSSGILTEGVTGGKIVICTGDTWMSDVLCAFGGGLAIADRSPRALAEAIAEIVENFPVFQARAATAATYWKNIHSPENFLTSLLDGSGDEAASRAPPTALVIYPWGDAVLGQSGAAARLRFLVRYLERHYREVRVLFTAVTEPGGPIGDRSHACPYHYRSRIKRYLYILLECANRLLLGKAGGSFHLWHHLWPLYDRRFKARCAEMISAVDDVFVEYTYFARVVASICREQGKDITITEYDVVSEQSKGTPIVHGLTKSLEFGALRHATRIVVANEDEQHALKEQGIASTLVPHPIDADQADLGWESEEVRFIIERIYGIPVAGKRFCLFIGSSYAPNIAAARFVRAMAARMGQDPAAEGIHFIVVGGCMEPVQEPCFTALGRIEDAGLSACYALADIVLVPLTEGTGTSVKSIEALANGALVLATSVGMRGLPIESGVHCLIEDNLDAFPERIRALLDEPEKAATIRAAARRFSAAYDYRETFRAYDLPGRTQATIQFDLTATRERRKAAALRGLWPRAQELADQAIEQFFAERIDLGNWLGTDFTTPDVPSGNTSAGVKATPIGGELGRPQKLSAELPARSGSWLRRSARTAVLRLVPPIRRLHNEVLASKARYTVLERDRNALRQKLRLAERKLAQSARDGDQKERSAESVLREALDRLEALDSGLIGLRDRSDMVHEVAIQQLVEKATARVTALQKMLEQRSDTAKDRSRLSEGKDSPPQIQDGRAQRTAAELLRRE